jgi:pimeloyl-ACP methyl ester carboxylesterase
MSLETLVLVPGLMCDHAIWQPLMPALAAQRHCVVIDHGDSDDLQDMAARVLAQAPARFALAGHSMGGRVALEVMRLSPERVTHLALMDTGHLPKAAGEAGQEEAAKRHALLKIAQAQGVRAMARDWVQGMVHPSRLKDAALVDAILDMFERKSADVFARQIKALLHRPDATAVLGALKLPTLVQCGRQDSWANLAQHQALHALVPGARLDVIEDAGHMAPMERPQAVAASLLNWLAQEGQ